MISLPPLDYSGTAEDSASIFTCTADTVPQLDWRLLACGVRGPGDPPEPKLITPPFRASWPFVVFAPVKKCIDCAHYSRERAWCKFSDAPVEVARRHMCRLEGLNFELKCPASAFGSTWG